MTNHDASTELASFRLRLVRFVKWLTIISVSVVALLWAGWQLPALRAIVHNSEAQGINTEGLFYSEVEVVHDITRKLGMEAAQIDDSTPVASEERSGQ